MISTEFYIDLPVGEKLKLHKNRWFPNQSIGNPKRASIITGIHGDELEGQYVCYLLGEWLGNNPDKLTGIVDIYPSANPLGVDSIMRSFPFYDVDLNRNFPGNESGYVPAQLTHALVESVKGSDLAIDIHSSNIFLQEIPQVRISEEQAKKLIPMAKTLGVDFIWIHNAVTVLESTLSHALNSNGIPTLVVEMGVGMRITKEYGYQLFLGILHLLHDMGIISEAPEEKPLSKRPLSTDKGEVSYLNANHSGIFIPEMDHCDTLKKGDLIGKVVDPLTATVKEEIISEVNGLLFTLRAYPVVYEGSLLARIFEKTKTKK